jgi:hypothetical protein
MCVKTYILNFLKKTAQALFQTISEVRTVSEQKMDEPATLENTLAFELDEGSDGSDGRLPEATNVALDGLVHQGDLGSEHGQVLLTRPLQLFNLLPLQR